MLSSSELHSQIMNCFLITLKFKVSDHLHHFPLIILNNEFNASNHFYKLFVFSRCKVEVAEIYLRESVFRAQLG